MSSNLVHMTRWLSDQEQRLWRDFLRVHIDLQAAIGRDLQVSSGLAAGEFQVLVHLSEAPERRLRVTELAHSMRWERSRLSHQLSRMEKRGLIIRRECPEDARGAFAELTPRGADAIEAAAPAHVETVRRVLFDTLTQDQLRSLGEICATVLAGLDQGASGAPGVSGSSSDPGMEGSR